MSQQKHTPEPWFVAGRIPEKGLQIEGKHGNSVALVHDDGGIWDAGDAGRIVACVNACAGIPNDAVSAVVQFGLNGHSKALENCEARREYWSDRWANEFDMRMAAEKRSDELSADAARYRFLKFGDPVISHGIFTDTEESEWDQEIDKAIANTKGGAA